MVTNARTTSKESGVKGRESMFASRKTSADGTAPGYRFWTLSCAALSWVGSMSVARYWTGRKPSRKRMAMSPLPHPTSRHLDPYGTCTSSRIHRYSLLARRAADRFTKNRETACISGMVESGGPGEGTTLQLGRQSESLAAGGRGPRRTGRRGEPNCNRRSLYQAGLNRVNHAEVHRHPSPGEPHARPVEETTTRAEGFVRCHSSRHSVQRQGGQGLLCARRSEPGSGSEAPPTRRHRVRVDQRDRIHSRLSPRPRLRNGRSVVRSLDTA